MINKKCLVCNNIFIPSLGNLRRGGGKYCSMLCYHKQSISHKKGKLSPFWKGKNAGYAAIHDWIKSIYGKATKCENPNCENISIVFDWALKKGKKYENREVENFWQLCRKCHKKYDFVEKPRDEKGHFLKLKDYIPIDRKIDKRYK